jgi:TPR repeat protein
MILAGIAAARPAHPYPGLRPFEAHEWSIFFGRERMIDEVIDRLARDRAVVVHGASGSGKSSLIRAGVLPKLSRQFLRHGVPWLTCAMRPSGGPLWNLAAEFVRLEGRAGDLTRIQAVHGLFNRRDATLASVVAACEGLAGKSVCILVDQFEELFRYERETSREEAELFVDLIGRAAKEPDGSKSLDSAETHVVVTMRSEFLGNCARFDGLAETINRTQYLVPRMDDDALTRAVRRPAHMYNGDIDEALAARLINSVRGREDELPLLQHGLMMMWDEAVLDKTRERIVLDGAVVDRAGGLAELLSSHADRVMDAAAPDASRASLVESMFRELTDVNAEGSAIRRPRALRDLAAVAGSTSDELRPLVDAFRAPGVTFVTPYEPTPLTEKTVIDISHEALIRCWRRISALKDGWLKRELDDGLAWRSLLIEATGFAEDKRRVLSAAATEDRSRLFAKRGEAWSRRYGGGWPLVRELLDASRTAAAKARRRNLAATAALAALSLVAAGASVVSLVGWTEARRANAIAEEQKAVAEQQKAAAIEEKTQAESAKVMAEAQKAVAEDERARAVQIDKLERSFLEALLEAGAPHSRDTKALAQPELDQLGTLARSGNDTFAEMMGAIYERGLAVPRNYKEATRWYGIAAANGQVVAMRKLGELYGYGDNPNGLTQDTIKSRGWYERAASGDDPEAMRRLGAINQSGQQYGQALEWYEKAADLDNAAARCDLGMLISESRFEQQDIQPEFKAARDWTERHDRVDMRNCGLLYENGQGVAHDFFKARNWYERAALAHDAAAMRSLGLLYQTGQGGPRDYTRARDWLAKAAAEGDVIAMRSLGSLYQNSQSGLQDYAKARDWLAKAAAADDTIAMRGLGFLYQSRQSGQQNYAKAREWFEKAGEAGDVIAMRQLGLLYENAQSGLRDPAKAREWFERAAIRDDLWSIRQMGVIYESGEPYGLTSDPKKAMEWYEKAVERGSPAAWCDLGLLIEKGLVARDEIPQDLKEARHWAENRSLAEMRNCGRMYQNGESVPPDPVKARDWLEKSAAGGDPVAMRSLGFLNQGQGGPQDYTAARRWFEKSAAAGDAVAMRNLGLMNQSGQGGPQDYTAARQWFEKAAAAGDTFAMRSLGSLYENSDSGLQDFAKAREWYQKATDAGDVPAMRSLGLLYENGQGGPQDFAQARQWYEKAANQGNAAAMCDLSFASEQGLGASKDPEKAREWFEKAGAGATRVCGDVYGNKSDRALIARDFGRALAFAESAQALEPDRLWIEHNRANALMFLGRTEDARALYLAHDDEPSGNRAGNPWRKAVAQDFERFRKAGLSNPLMEEVEAALSATTH